eukprot:TRINITY_DN6235_c0_g1_i1.p1 TRINITY_DN6235_c0_g1~~TRINITY_DN6235_c0_g1_i1.p1  ORF type:complete len:328 (-),score=110.13 TRINITY_DN6235_c0_g1_i1:7-990(-)
MSSTVRILSGDDVKSCITMRQAIDCNRSAFESLFRGNIQVPKRLIVNDENGPTLFKPALIKDGGGLGIKIVGVRSKNEEKGLSNVPGTVVLIDQETGLVKAMMDGTYLTGLRTAAGSAAATEVLSKRDSKVLAVFGAGLQSQMHIEAICEIRPIQQVYVVNRTQEKAESLCKTMREKYPNIKFGASDEKRAVEEADIIVTATNSTSPVLHGSLLNHRVHINAVGSYTPTMQELDSEVIRRSKVFVDDLDALDAGDISIPIKDGTVTKEEIFIGTIGQLFHEGDSLFKVDDHQITIFKSVGTAAQDVATAVEVFKTAEREGRGQVIKF